MDRKTEIGNFEAACILLNMISSKIILDFPRTVSEDAGSAAWLMVLLDSVVVYLLFLVISRLYRKFAGNDLLDVSEAAFGETGRIIAGIIFLIQFMYITHVVLRQFAEDIKVISLASTPVSVVILLFCAGMIVGAYLGIEAISRLHVIAIPLLAAAFLLILLFNIPRYDISKISPWLGLGIGAILKNGVINLSYFSELAALFFLMPFLKKKNSFGGVGRYGIFFSGLFLVLVSLCYLMVYQYPMSTEFFLPVYQMARTIKIGRFFSRIEPAFILIWASSAFLYLSSGLFFITYIFQRTFNLKYRKPLIVPFIILIFALSLLPENLYSTLQSEMHVYRLLSWLVTLILPIILLVIASTRAKSNKHREEARHD
ncbi:MAG: endospore germination permease [Clostridiaceae bacterium]|nr:endospore germination permease [Clostridiaceae bacterium]